MHAMHAMDTQRSQQLQEARDRLETEAQELAETPVDTPLPNRGNASPLANEGHQSDSPLGSQERSAPNSPATLGDALESGPAEGHPDLAKVLETNDTLTQSIRNGYPDDPMFRLVLARAIRKILHDS